MNEEDTKAPANTKINWQRLKTSRRRPREPAAQTEKSVTIRLVDTHHKIATARGFSIESDEPFEVGGQDIAPQPTEFMLMSLGFCQMSIIVHYAEAMRIALEDVEVTVVGHRDDRGLLGQADVRPGFYQIAMNTRLVSNEPSSRLAKLASRAETRCPVFDNLSAPTPIRNQVTWSDIVIHESGQ